MRECSPDDLVCENCGNEDQDEFYETVKREKGDHKMTCAVCDWADRVTTRRERDGFADRMAREEADREAERLRLRESLRKGMEGWSPDEI